jgi:cysteine-rich repeat protein
VRAHNTIGNSNYSNTDNDTTLNGPACGDGTLDPPDEECDDNNTVSGDGCSAICEIEYCGDGTVQAGLGEQCDDGNTVSGDGCSAICEIEYCGDGTVQGGLGEQCDDGNTVSGDGCSEDCLLEAPGGGGETLWAEGFGNTGHETGNAVTVDSNGNLFSAGYFQGTVDLGCGPLTATGAKDAFVAKYSSTGACLWAKRFGAGSVTQSSVQAVAVDTFDNVIVAGYFDGTIDFGGSTLTSEGGYDFFIAKFSPAGARLWSTNFGWDQDDFAHGIAVNNSNDIVVVGEYNDAGTVVKFTSSGTYQWIKNFGSGEPYEVATDSSDNIVVTGYFQGMIDFGGGQVTSNGFSRDVFVAKLSPVGSYIWQKTFGDTDNDIGYGITVAPDDAVAVTGYFQGTVDFGGGQVTSNGSEMFIAKYSASGTYLFGLHFDGTGGSVSSYGITTDSIGNILATGGFSGSVNFGGGPHLSIGSQDIFVAKFSPVGSHIWSQSFGSTISGGGKSVAVGSSGIYVTGNFSGTTDFGGPILSSAGGMDIFLMKLTP